MATDDDAARPDEAPEAEDAGADCPDFGDDARKWLLAINRTVEKVFTGDDIPDGPVRTAYNRFLRAAFDRMARICRGDIIEKE